MDRLVDIVVGAAAAEVAAASGRTSAATHRALHRRRWFVDTIGLLVAAVRTERGSVRTAGGDAGPGGPRGRAY
ncbi:hypothetical protein GCM10022220_71580 [Actinocatenispora rupis]|uniref:Uncharacterized protein n=1 Tax=Actinocatenispora rupis TaxID=519421 RepID=A0A8J3NFE1_9ACTN|nr:hypothetical protein Aru02nite_60610 [Actinocatenispora rupis]